MSAIYESQLNGDEREFMSDISGISLEIAKYRTMLEMVDMKFETDLKEADVKVFKESGNYDDLEYLYEEASNEASEKKNNIIKKIINAIRNLFGKLSNFIKTKILKKPVSGEVEVDQSDIDNANAAKNVFGAVKSGLNAIKDGATEHPWIVGGSIVTGSALAALVGFNVKKASGKKVKKSADEVKQLGNMLDETISQPIQQLMTKFESFKNGKNPIVTKVLEEIDKFGNKVTSVVTSISSKLTGVSTQEDSTDKVDGNTDAKEIYKKEQSEERLKHREDLKKRWYSDKDDESFNKMMRDANKSKNGKKDEPPVSDVDKEKAAKKNLEKTKERLLTDENKKKLEKKQIDSGSMQLSKLFNKKTGKTMKKTMFKPGKERHNVYTMVDGIWYKYVLTNKKGFDDDPNNWTVGSREQVIGKNKPIFESAEEFLEYALSFDELESIFESDENYELTLHEIIMNESVEEFFVTLDSDIYNEYVTAILDDDSEPLTESQGNLLGYDPEVELSIYEESAINEEINALVMAFDAL